MVVLLVLSRLDFGNTTLTGIPAYLLQRLHLIMNATARLIFLSWKCDLISPLLSQLHWLKASKRITYKVAVLVYKCQHGWPADTESRRQLCSASSTSLDVRRTSLSTVGDKAFSVAATHLWNSLPSFHRMSLLSLPSSAVILNHISSHFLSYPAFWLFYHLYCAHRVTCHFGDYI